MATSPNYGWLEPDNTDLVKNGALAIRTLGNAIDTTMATMVPKSIVDAKGDLIVGTAADTVGRLAVAENGSTIVADSSTSTGLSYQANWAAGKNKIINGDFRINQRSFTSTTTSATFGFDRWTTFIAGDGTCTYSAQTFTAGTAPVAGYEGTNFARLLTASQTTTAVASRLEQPIEDVRTYANQTVVISFWAKVASGTPKIAVEMTQGFGSGGSTSVNTYAGQVTLSTSWARYSVSVAIPSISGKTIGTGSSLITRLYVSAGSDFAARTGSIGIQNNTFDIWGVQVEAGSVATAFQTATGTIQGELSAAQRYYFRQTSNSTNGAAVPMTTGIAGSTTALYAIMNYPVTMRSVPTSVDFALVNSWQGGGLTAISNVTLASNSVGTDKALLNCTTTGLTNGQSYGVLTNASGVAGYIGLSAEL
jgi:hypothetical protein